MSTTPKASEAIGAGSAAASPAPVSFSEAFRFWLKLGFISFGGPAGQIAIMHQELVERRRWISERRFMHALNYCMDYRDRSCEPTRCAFAANRTPRAPAHALQIPYHFALSPAVQSN
jgi:hypothetical protein